MKIKVSTLFDCTATGVTGHYRYDKLPFYTDNGVRVVDHPGWMRVRNQQRNWETVTQILQLRTQIELTEVPEVNDLGHWQFHFEVENSGAYQNNDQQLGALLDDCENVPIVIGLGEEPGCAPRIHTSGPEQNIWFQLIE